MTAISKRGSEVGFNVAAENALKANPALAAVKIVIEDYLDEALSRAPCLQGNESDSEPPAADRKPVVMLVGNDDNIAVVVKIVLHDLAHTLIWARNAEEVIEKIHQNLPDIILGESVSSNADGFNLIQIAKTHPETANTPVVLLNPESNLDSIFAAYSAINRTKSAEHAESPPIVDP